MRPQTIAVLLMSLVFGGSAAIGVWSFVGSRPETVEQVTVVVPAIDLARNTVLTREVLATRQVPRSLVSPGVVASVDLALDRSTLTALVQGEPILDARLSPKGQRGLAALIPANMRAYTITTSNVAAGVAGLIFPGNKVDVLLTVTANTFGIGSESTPMDPTGGGSTTTLLQNVEVLAVDQALEAPSASTAPGAVKGPDLRSVTLLVKPLQAQMLRLGESKGSLHLSLRSQDDQSDPHTEPTVLADLRFARHDPNEPTALERLLKGMGQAVAEAQKARAAAAETRPRAPAATPAPAPPRKVVINTIRGGRHTGRQELELPPLPRSPSP